MAGEIIVKVERETDLLYKRKKGFLTRMDKELFCNKGIHKRDRVVLKRRDSSEGRG